MNRIALYFCTFLYFTFLGCLAAGSSLYAAPAKTKPSKIKASGKVNVSNKPSSPAQDHPMWKAQDNSLPVQSGPGIVICDPVTGPADTTGNNFGTGCAFWLHMTVGGQPQLGKTPLLSSLGRAHRELGKANLQLSAAQALNLAPILGVTHVAVGTLQGQGQHMTLTYHLLKVPSGSPVGPPITLSGTKEVIIAGLPQIAKTMAQRLGIAAPDIPASTGLSLDDLQLLGQIRWQPTALTESQRASVHALADRDPLGVLMSISFGLYSTHADINAAVRTLLTQAGANPLMWGAIAFLCEAASAGAVSPVIEDVLAPYKTQLSALTTRYPGNYNLAEAETIYNRVIADHKQELLAAERITTDVPHSPDGWLTDGASIEFAANQVRWGRAYDELLPEETEALGKLYPQWLAATKRAAHLDPAYGKAWLRLAVAATFYGDTALADYAMQTALVRLADKTPAYNWAIQMYQPKWGGDPDKLANIAKRAAADPTMSGLWVARMAGDLGGVGETDLQRQVLRVYVSRERAYLATHPDDASGHRDLIMAIKYLVDRESDSAGTQAANSLPPAQAATQQYGLGMVHFSAGAIDQASGYFREAIRLDPHYPEAHFYLGRCQMRLGHYDEAKSELQTALHLSPEYGPAYAALGEVLLQQNKAAEAIPDMQKAIHLGDLLENNYERLIEALDKTGQYDQVLTIGAAALAIYTDGDVTIYDSMADAYLHKKEWDKSLAISQKSVALKADDAGAHENIAEAYLGAGHIAEAKVEWEKVLTLKDDGLKAVATDYLKKYP